VLEVGGEVRPAVDGFEHVGQPHARDQPVGRRRDRVDTRRIVEFGLLRKAQPVTGKQLRILGRQPPRDAEQRPVELGRPHGEVGIGTRRRHDWHPRRLGGRDGCRRRREQVIERAVQTRGRNPDVTAGEGVGECEEGCELVVGAVDPALCDDVMAPASLDVAEWQGGRQRLAPVAAEVAKDCHRREQRRRGTPPLEGE
jgi:hypothetical protein